MSTKCEGCNGKGTWFSPMRGDIECDWCFGTGQVCGCSTKDKGGSKCWRCGHYVEPYTPEDTEEFPAVNMSGIVDQDFDWSIF